MTTNIMITYLTVLSQFLNWDTVFVVELDEYTLDQEPKDTNIMS
jgi:hypothetical protein